MDGQTTSLTQILERATELQVVQLPEMLELLGFEGRNKYVIEAEGDRIAFAAEQGSGPLAFLGRVFLGHWRTFEIHLFDATQTLVMRALHPFRFFLHRLEISDAQGQPIGSIQQRWSGYQRLFDVVIASTGTVLIASSPFWRPWTFVFERDGRDVARVEKKWSGLLQEALTDADTFRLVFVADDLSRDERSLLLTAALFIDLQYFEKKGSGGALNSDD